MGNRLAKILKWALDTLPNQPNALDKELLQTQKVLRKIARRWKSQRTGWNLPKTQNTDIPFFRILHLRQRTFVKSPNEYHPKATRIYKTDILINAEGKIEVSITYGYPREGNGWGLQYKQHPNEDGPQALERIANKIETLLIPVKPSPYGYALHISSEHMETIAREDHYNNLTNVYNGSLRSLCRQDHFGTIIPDKGTKAAFGNIKNTPCSLSYEIASMLADLMARNNVTQAEMEIIAAGLKTARRLTIPNLTLDRFTTTLNKNIINAKGLMEKAPPDYQTLKQGIREAKNRNAMVLVWLPHPSKPGLIRVPWKHVRLNMRLNQITYQNHTHNIKEIRQFDVIPKTMNPEKNITSP